jgi:hypothetical protein
MFLIKSLLNVCIACLSICLPIKACSGRTPNKDRNTSHVLVVCSLLAQSTDGKQPVVVEKSGATTAAISEKR